MLLQFVLNSLETETVIGEAGKLLNTTNAASPSTTLIQAQDLSLFNTFKAEN